MKKFIRMSDILEQTGLGSTSTVYARIKAGLWTKPIHLSGRASFWIEEEVEALLDAAAAGYDDEKIRALVQQLHEKRISFAS